MATRRSREPAASRKGQQSEFRIVGIGGSAGGLEPFKAILRGLGLSSRMAFIFVQHLDPAHPSILAQLLSRETEMAVFEIEDKMRIELGHVYVSPGSMDVTIQKGRFRIRRRTTAGLHLPINKFFVSLSQQYGKRAIGVVLSGLGSDGTTGLQAIKAAGGISFAQNESSAAFSSMPSSAIAAQAVDYILSPERIAEQLGKLQDRLAPATARQSSADRTIQDVFGILRRSKGVDFSNYKFANMQRRIQRRMLLNRLTDVAKYVEMLQDNRQEIEALFDDILIHVTRFFREPDRLEFLQETLLPRILKNLSGDQPLRVWVAGCSSGEEAYSLAILLLETLSRMRFSRDLRIFATDISDSQIQKARFGMYSDSIEKNVSKERLANFFVKHDGQYQVAKAVRNRCVFAKHDAMRDPPFSRIDLVICRNLLIYLTPDAQKRVLQALHYALAPAGILILGKSESIRNLSSLFVTIDRKHHVYSRIHLSVPASGLFSRSSLRPPALNGAAGKSMTILDWDKEADKVILERHGHAGLLVDENQNILSFRGAISRFLDPECGMASLELTSMIHKELRLDVRMVVREAKRTNSLACRHNLQVRLGGAAETVNLEAFPLQNPKDQQRMFLVLFIETPQQQGGMWGRPGRKSISLVAQLQRELDELRQNMRANSEELERLNAELVSSNEELESANEELQSSNEEFQTATEELESSNEELTTLNEELHTRNAELDKKNLEITSAKDFSEAVLDTIAQPLLVVGRDMTVKAANPAWCRMFQLDKSDVEGADLRKIDGDAWNSQRLADEIAICLKCPEKAHIFQFDQEFLRIGCKRLKVAARAVVRKRGQDDCILLALEDLTARS